MKTEVDNKIFSLQINPPKIKLMSHDQRIMHLSELAEVFTREEIEEALEEAHRVNKKKENE